MPPGSFGGNLDTRQLVAGTTLYLPVEVEGAMFSCGDAHAAQGDGEVCVTGLESPMYATLRFSLEKGRRIPAPQYRTRRPADPARRRRPLVRDDRRRPRPVRRGAERVRAMIDHLAASYGLSREDAYVLSSLAST